MKHITIVGNWKSNKRTSEAESWVASFAELIKPERDKLKEMTIIIAPSFTALSTMKQAIKTYEVPILLASQNISPFGMGAYTGEVNATEIKELADYVIIGHSERRKYFAEDDVVLERKVDQAKSAGLKVIYCVPDANTRVPTGVDIVGYEPVWAIGTGRTDTPDNANAVVKTIKERTGASITVYGGSVVSENVASFVSTETIDGVLPGGASMDPQKFVSLVMNAVV